MVYDDLHVIRSFTAEEVWTSFHGHWDPDGIETQGYRPFTLLFNFLRYALFGENVVGHRLFLIALFAAYLTSLACVARRLGATPGTVVAAGLLCVCARYSVYHYVWIGDGMHLFQGLAVGLALIALLRGLDGGGPGWLAGSFLGLLAALLTREDTLAVIPVVLLIGAWRIRTAPQPRPEASRRLIGLGASLAALILALFAYRARVVPQAPPIALDLAGLAGM